MHALAQNYNPKSWAGHGPTLLKNAIKDYCNVSNIYSNISEPSKIKSINFDCDISILPQAFFYPYSWENVSELFKKDSCIDIKKMKMAYSIHFYGKLSRDFAHKPDENTIFEYFAKINCPKSYLFQNE